jgi:hypothetical protein
MCTFVLTIGGLLNHPGAGSHGNVVHADHERYFVNFIEVRLVHCLFVL